MIPIYPNQITHAWNNFVRLFTTSLLYSQFPRLLKKFNIFFAIDWVLDELQWVRLSWLTPRLFFFLQPSGRTWPSTPNRPSESDSLRERIIFSEKLKNQKNGKAWWSIRRISLLLVGATAGRQRSGEMSVPRQASCSPVSLSLVGERRVHVRSRACTARISPFFLSLARARHRDEALLRWHKAPFVTLLSAVSPSDFSFFAKFGRVLPRRGVSVTDSAGLTGFFCFPEESLESLAHLHLLINHDLGEALFTIRDSCCYRGYAQSLVRATSFRRNSRVHVDVYVDPGIHVNEVSVDLTLNAITNRVGNFAGAFIDVGLLIDEFNRQRSFPRWQFWNWTVQSQFGMERGFIRGEMCKAFYASNSSALGLPVSRHANQNKSIQI